ncbi:MAG: tripartite tricarboxylate transporter TctB family protein [Planctomycetaceae bacterium]
MEGRSRVNEKITAAILLIFSLLYFFKGLSLQVGVPKNPGPGFIPFIIGILLISCSGIYLVRVFRKADLEGNGRKTSEGEKRNYAAILGITACAILFPLVLETLKFLTTTFVVSLFMFLVLKPKKRALAFVLAAGMSISSFLIFSRLLGVGLPMGFLETFFFHLGG